MVFENIIIILSMYTKIKIYRNVKEMSKNVKEMSRKCQNNYIILDFIN